MIQDLAARVAEAPCLLLMLDYDGTLSPIAPTPQEARALAGAVEVLDGLARLPSTMVAVVSGRAMGDLEGRVPCHDVVLCGNHGMEVRGVDVPLPSLRPLLDKAMIIERDVSRRVDAIDGVLIENKGPVVSVHHRLVDDVRVGEIEHAVEVVASAHGARVMRGKRVLEMRPDVPVDKGSTVRALIDAARSRFGQEPLALYAGDDTTDEDAFAAMDGGITVLVAHDSRTTRARHLARDPSELLAFLQEVERRRRARGAAGGEENGPLI